MCVHVHENDIACNSNNTLIIIYYYYLSCVHAVIMQLCIASYVQCIGVYIIIMSVQHYHNNNYNNYALHNIEIERSISPCSDVPIILNQILNAHSAIIKLI